LCRGPDSSGDHYRNNQRSHRSRDRRRSYRGFRQPQENLNVSRNFRFGERLLLHVRVEFQNVFNRTRLPQPTGGNFSAAPTTFTSGANTGLYNGGFGTILPTGGTAGFRTGTFIGRITF
jgi:hypothetical protein